MKNLKIFSLTILFIFIFSITSFAANQATSSPLPNLDSLKLTEGTETTEEIDPYDIITFPSFTYVDNIKITVDDSKIGSYKFFYQTIDLTDSEHTALENAINSYKNDLDAAKKQIDTKTEELKAEQEKCNELATAYQEAYNQDPNSEETKAAKQKYDEASSNLITHQAELTTYIKEQVKSFEQRLEAIRAMYPKYDDSKWIQSDTNTASYTKQVTKKTYFALWVKVETADNSYYAVTEYSQEASSSYNNTINNTTNNTITNNTSSADNTKAPTKLPDAGNPLVTFTVIAFISVIGGYFYIRYNTIDK